MNSFSLTLNPTTADMAREAESLVRRARLGDQNAMGMISMVRQNAGKNPRAKMAYVAIEKYLRLHPIGGASGMGSEVQSAKLAKRYPRGLLQATANMANGPLLTDTRIREAADKLGGDKGKLFLFACVNYRKPRKLQAMSATYPEGLAALQKGSAVGRARAIQKVRMPGTSFLEFSPAVGWELGE